MLAGEQLSALVLFNIECTEYSSIGSERVPYRPSIGRSIHSKLMRSTSIYPLVLTIVLLGPVCLAWADLNDDAVNRCINEVGEFGDGMVRTCVEQDVSAAKALTTYPREAREIVARCTERLQGRGWSMVKLCVDRDLDAAPALAAFAKEHPAALERCQKQAGDLGAAKVKECVEREAER